MSNSQSPLPAPSTSANANAIAAAAAERRTRQLPQQLSATQLAAQHERRQTFRRLVDPGILRPNSKEQAIASLKTLLTIAENLLNEPENPKYQQFKPTNTVIKRNLVVPKGALEYAIELGFRPEVKDFQPFYIFNPQKVEDLRVGAAILKEFVELEYEKAEREARSKVDQKAVNQAIANQVKLAFLDDRKSKSLNDERERERRAAHATAMARQAGLPTSTSNSQPSSPSPSQLMPGSGHMLNGDGPPPYEYGGDDD